LIKKKFSKKFKCETILAFFWVKNGPKKLFTSSGGGKGVICELNLTMGGRTVKQNLS
jgi:hypothetical protein